MTFPDRNPSSRRTPQAEEAIGSRSRLLFSVKCLRQSDSYPYEIAVFDSELSVPIGAGDDARQDALAAWFKMMEAGVAVGHALARERESLAVSPSGSAEQ